MVDLLPQNRYRKEDEPPFLASCTFINKIITHMEHYITIVPPQPHCCYHCITNHNNSGITQPYFTFNRTNEPLGGTFRPYTHPRTSSPILQGEAHFEKSDFGIPSLFAGVSITSGSIVTTLLSELVSLPAKEVARECTPVLARAQAIISGCGSWQTAAAPVNTTSPLGLSSCVARWAVSRQGCRLTLLICLTFSRQSLSAMLPPVHPPAVTTMASKVVLSCLMVCMACLLLCWGDWSE